MKSRLEQFIRDNREEFDDEEPGRKIWDKIEFQLEPVKQQPASIVRIGWARWSVAAAVILLLAGSVWFFTRTAKAPKDEMASNHLPAVPSVTPDKGDQKSPATTAPADSAAQSPVRQHPALADAGAPSKAAAEDPDATYKEEMYHYARLVELKHKELKTIEKDEPLLYKKFASDVNKLDSVYHTLEKELPQNPNREQLLEAMIQNLQLQMGLLNHQLDIIKKINHSKKTAYEKAYKTI